MNVHVLALWWVLLLAGAFEGRAELISNGVPVNPATGRASDLFGITYLYAFHLTISPDQWAVMEEPDGVRENPVHPEGAHDGTRPFSPPPTPLRTGLGPGPQPGGNGPKMGAEFKEGAAEMEFEGRHFGAIRVRFKGHSSFRFARHSLKRSLQLDFNDLAKGRTFFGLTKLNLNNNAMDPSQIREALAYHIFRSGGVPAGRTAFAKVFITVPGRYDRAYAGLYTMVEQVDDRFLKEHFGTKAGLLLKPEGLAGLPNLGNAWPAFNDQAKAKGSLLAADAARFIEMVKGLNQVDEAQFQAAMGDFLEVDELLRFLAVECLLSNLDSPLLSGHNYFLYLHPKTRKFTWLPWDLNESFGGFGPGGNAAEQMDLSLDRSLTNANLFAARLLQAPGFRQRYQETVRRLLDNPFNATRLFPLIDAMTAVIRPALANDPMVSSSQFEAALSEELLPTRAVPDEPKPGSVPPGGPGGAGGPGGPRPPLKAFINRRTASAWLQLEGKANGYVPKGMSVGPNMGPPPPGEF
jgi:spore coat protein H